MKKEVSNEMNNKVMAYVRRARRVKRKLYYVTAVKLYNKALDIIREYEYASINEEIEISEFELFWKKFKIKAERFFAVHSLGGILFFDLELDDYYEYEYEIEEEFEAVEE